MKQRTCNGCISTQIRVRKKWLRHSTCHQDVLSFIQWVKQFDERSPFYVVVGAVTVRVSERVLGDEDSDRVLSSGPRLQPRLARRQTSLRDPVFIHGGWTAPLPTVRYRVATAARGRYVKRRCPATTYWFWEVVPQAVLDRCKFFNGVVVLIVSNPNTIFAFLELLTYCFGISYIWSHTETMKCWFHCYCVSDVNQ